MPTFHDVLMQHLDGLDDDELERLKLELVNKDDKNVFAGLAEEPLSALEVILRLLAKDTEELAARKAILSLCAIRRRDVAEDIYWWSYAKGRFDISNIISAVLRRTTGIDLEDQELDIINISRHSFASLEKDKYAQLQYFCLGKIFVGVSAILHSLMLGTVLVGVGFTNWKTSLTRGIRTETRMDSDYSEECLKCGFLSSMTFPEKTRPDIVQDPEISGETYRLDISEPGSVHCDITGLIFDVRTAVTITYHFDSWSNHMDDGKKSNLTVVGPLLNIEAIPVEAVAAVHFPHVLCLAAGTRRSQVYIAHFTENGMTLEKPDRLEIGHAILYNPRFSPCGVVLKKSWFKRKTKVHAVVLLYQKQNVPKPTLHLYLLPNDSSLKKAVHDWENMCPSMRLTKPPSTRYPLNLGSCFFVRTAHHVQVCPEELILYYLRADMEQQYVELYMEHVEDKLELNVMERKKDKLVWETCVRRGDLMLDSVESHQESMRGSPVTRSFPEDKNLLGACSYPCQGAEFTSITSERDELHFIDKHREELIQRTTNVEGVLDMLHGRILSEDQYQKIASKNINPEKMRELYKLMPSWDKNCKNQLYKALKAKHPYLIDEINRRPNLKEEAPQKT